MKKLLLAIFVAASLASASPAVAQEKPVDLIVLLDASQSMFPYFTEVVDFVVSRIAREYLRFGDTFHLLTFTDTVQIEIAQSVKTEQDLKRLLGRLYLLYPLGKNTDLLSALTSLYRYTSDLPESSRKLIVMVTDGMHNPSPKSSYSGLGAKEVRDGIEKTAARIRENGWTIRIVRVPFDNGAAEAPSGSGAPGKPAAAGEVLGSSPGAGDYLSEVATGLGAPVTDFTSEDRESAALLSVEIPRATFPGSLGKTGYSFTFPLGLTNSSSRDLRLELAGVYFRGESILRKNVFTDLPGKGASTMQIPVDLPEDLPPGPTSIEIELRFAEGVRVVPTVGTLSFELENRPLQRIFRTTGRAALFLVLLILVLGLILALVIYVRSLHKRTARPIVTAVLDSEAAAAAERRKALSQAHAERPSYVSPEEARDMASGLIPKHVTAEEAETFREELSPKHVTSEEAAAFASDLVPKHVTSEEARLFGEGRASISEEEARRFAANRTITEEEASRYRDETSRNAAEALAAFAASASPDLRASGAERSFSYTPVIRRAGSLRVEFRVEEQNPYVGLRNVRTLQSGGKKTLGGGRSDFLVFLMPVPAHVAEVHYDGEDLTLVPLKPEFFPDYDGPVSGCLNTPIRMVTRQGRPLVLSFTPYVPPAERINRLLHCVDFPGLAPPEKPAAPDTKDS